MDNNTNAPILSLKNISKNFGSLEILQNINFEINAGDTVGILGPSGAGKSTLLHIAGLMENPTEGSVEFLGQRTENCPDSLRAQMRLDSIGFIFQFHHLLPEFNVLENVLIPCRIGKDNLEQKEEEARKLLSLLGLQNRLTHRPNQLSGGEQQRTAMARALIRHPKVLLCDEPTGNLDHKRGEEMMDILFDEVLKKNLAVVIVTHNLELVKRVRKSYTLVNGNLQS